MAQVIGSNILRAQILILQILSALNTCQLYQTAPSTIQVNKCICR